MKLKETSGAVGSMRARRIEDRKPVASPKPEALCLKQSKTGP